MPKTSSSKTKTNKKKFLSLFDKFSYFNSLTEIRKLHSEMLKLLKDSKPSTAPGKRVTVEKTVRSMQDKQDIGEFMEYVKNVGQFCYSSSRFPRYNQTMSNSSQTNNLTKKHY